MTAFQKNSLQRQLDSLKNSGVINNEQAIKLMEIYEKDTRDFTKIFNEVKSFLFNQDLLKEVLEKNTMVNGTKVSDMNLNDKKKAPLSLENITDFRKDGKDYVIIDSAPVGLLTDASALAQYADGAVFVVKKDFAKADHILDAMAHLSESDVEMMGCVLNVV